MKTHFLDDFVELLSDNLMVSQTYHCMFTCRNVLEDVLSL